MNAMIPGTDVWDVVSTTNGHTYRISVALPFGYTKNSEQRYPVVYLLDANRFFGMVAEMTRFMARCGRFPNVMVAGIGYATSADEPEAAFLDANPLRARDLTPAVDQTVDEGLAAQFGSQRGATGGAELFFRFIRDEVIPDVEGRYRADEARRVLAGHSLGGLFALHALFQEPGLFAGYVAASPSLFYGKRVLFDVEAAYAARTRTLPAALHLSVGSEEQGADAPPGFEMISNFEAFAARLVARPYAGFRLLLERFEACDHCDTPAVAFRSGLAAVLGES